MEVIVLDFYCMRCAAKRTGFAFAVKKTYFTNVFAAACNFNTDNFTAFKDVHPVVAGIFFVLVIHDHITPGLIVLFE